LKVSIVTIALNAKETLEDTIRSVLNQSYDDLEYIVVDGASTDGSLDIINKYRDNIDLVISEPDEGLYYAMNKGISMATGDVIGILNADDTYAGTDIIEKVARKMDETGADSLYGDLNYVHRNSPGNVVRRWKSGKFKRAFFLKGWMVPHPTFFVNKWVYVHFGLYNTRLKTSADYEFMLRVLYKGKISTCYLPQVMVNMKMGGRSNGSLLNRLRANKEDRMAWEINHIKPQTLTLIQKPFRKLSQFVILRS
jgi:glycosyltransferase involved in cell wall biosynthesis